MMHRRALLGALLAAACRALLSPALARAEEIETIQLRHRIADDVLPTLRAFLEPGGALTGQGYQLFLRTSRTNSRQLRELLAKLDRAPRQLMITVRQALEGAQAGRVIGADGSVTISNRGKTGSVDAEARDTRIAGTADSALTIRVLEGGRAYIAIGAAIPLTFRRWVLNTQEITEAQGTVYYEAVTGFYARPQLAGDLVTIELAPEQATLTSGGPERARLVTTVRGRLGEWIAVGGADGRDEARSTGSLSTADRSAASQRGVWLKVDEADATPR